MVLASFDLGNSSKQWGELWVTGTGNIDNLRLNSGSTVDEISNSLASFGSDQLMTANAIQNAILALSTYSLMIAMIFSCSSGVSSLSANVK